MNPLIQLKKASPPFLIAYSCLSAFTFATSAGGRSAARWRLSWRQHGGGNFGPFSLTTGSYNTAVGFFSLRSNTIGSFNTATGAGALLLNAGNNPNTQRQIRLPAPWRF